MKPQKFNFSRDGKKFIIETFKNDNGGIQVPYFKYPNTHLNEIAFFPDQDTFVEDLQSIIPVELPRDIGKFIHDGLYKTVQNHISKFGRITESDLDLYICETILVMEAIIKIDENRTVSYEEKSNFFFDIKRIFN